MCERACENWRRKTLGQVCNLYTVEQHVLPKHQFSTSIINTKKVYETGKSTTKDGKRGVKVHKSGAKWAIMEVYGVVIRYLYSETG